MRREILRDTGENFHGRIQLLQLTQEGGALDGTQCYGYFTRFKSGYQSSEDDPSLQLMTLTFRKLRIWCHANDV